MCISLNKSSIYCYIPGSSKHTDTCKWLGWVFCNHSYIFIFLFDVGFYCDIFTNIHATLLVFIVIVILIIVTVQCWW